MKVLGIIIAVLALMFAEYRFIMQEIQPFYEDGFLCLEVFGQVDQYFVEELLE